jgi:hypothetical protein
VCVCGRVGPIRKHSSGLFFVFIYQSGAVRNKVATILTTAMSSDSEGDDRAGVCANLGVGDPGTDPSSAVGEASVAV